MKHRLWVPRQPCKKVWHGYSKAHQDMVARMATGKGHMATSYGTAVAIPLLVGTLEKHQNGSPLCNSPG